MKNLSLPALLSLLLLAGCATAPNSPGIPVLIDAPFLGLKTHKTLMEEKRQKLAEVEAARMAAKEESERLKRLRGARAEVLKDLSGELGKLKALLAEEEKRIEDMVKKTDAEKDAAKMREAELADARTRIVKVEAEMATLSATPEDELVAKKVRLERELKEMSEKVSAGLR